MNAASVVELLQQLVRIPSVNPEGNPGTDRTGEGACAEAVGAFLRHAGATVSFQEVFPGRPNVVGVFPTDRPGKPRLYLAPHLDTVSVLGMTIDPFGGEVREGRVWGRGATDTKGPMSAMLWALWELRDVLPKLSHEIWFAGMMSEETGQHGSRAFVREFCHGFPGEQFAVVGEPTGKRIVHAHKGAVHLYATAEGHAVHSSRPEKGINAICRMIDLLERVRGELAPALEEWRNPVLGAPTCSIGTIEGGSRINIVPDRCEAAVDFRITPELSTAKGGDVLGWLKERLAGEGLTFDGREAAPLWTDPGHPLIALLEKAGGERGGAPWYCDAALFAEGAVPAVAAGPGDMAQAHTQDEWISIDVLQDGVTFYRQFLQQLL